MELDRITVSEVMERDVVCVHEKEPLSSVIGKMKETGIHEMPVVDSKGTLKGIFSYRMIVRRRNIPIYSKVENMLVYPPTILPDESLSSAIEKMMNVGHRVLPVIEKPGGRVIGLLTRRAIVRLIRRHRKLANTPVDDVMSGDPVVVREDEAVDVAVERMKGLGEVCLPVVDEHGHLRGMVLLRDIARSYWREKERESYGEVVGEKERMVIPVSSVMMAPAYVRSGSRVKDALDVMEDMDAYLVTVVDEDMKPVGVITDKDLIEMLYSTLPREGVFVQITGLDIEDPEPYDYIYSLVEPFLHKLYRTERFKPQILTFHVERHEVGGRESKYSVRARLGTDRRTFYAKGVDWNLFKAVREAMDNLERMVMREKKKLMEMSKTIR